ncbi:DUF418 domain-containing protein [Ferdinandcohnia quinoae]|uniref:DUF418 domain-containing protein n=1 Tax=Fredinandcohnia quinoae TaxID=2918902 RepID=A0AAW5E6J9_9BACI|nr:DUF418 domain-containing protein [Fredinandcohnia sp. SECRCQ15]MCH1625031.1 DUF418 domain-containing protein [Fredinandcohnia sp. SECRCQ15]
MNTKSKRITAVDGMRGLSLFGILVANMLIFQYGMWGKEEMDFYSPSQTDIFSHEFLKIFVEGSFMPIFTFLFGYGMIKMRQNLQSKGKKVKRHFFRRFLFLFGIGILHSTYLWEGDILLLYGLMGIFLLLFLNRKKKTMLVWGILLLIGTSLLGYGSLDETKEDKQIMDSYITNTIEIYGSGSYSEIMEHRNNEMPLNLPDYAYVILLLLAPLLSAPLFLIGMYAAENDLFREPRKEAFFYKVCVFLFVPIGLVLKSASLLSVPESCVGVAEIVGANILSLGYIFCIGLIYAYAKNSKLLKGFEAVGKLSFTNYLMQTVICTTIFYGYGFGLFGKLGVLAGFGLSIGIYLLQVVASSWYLSHFKTGPIEKILRIWTNLSFNGKVKEKSKLQLQKEIGA